MLNTENNVNLTPLIQGQAMPIIRRLIGAVAVLASFEIGRSAFAEELVNQGSGNPEHALKVFAKFFNCQQAQHRIPVPPSIRKG